jgi:acyl-CoA thioesterase FadM
LQKAVRFHDERLSGAIAMSLLFRLLYVLLLSLFRERLPVGVAVSRLHLRTLPNDLDINLHMNNGRYLTICDLNRFDLFVRTGLLRLMVRKKWMPMIVEHTMRYKRPLLVFRSFESVMEVTHWNEREFFMTHQFIHKGRVVAEGTSKAVIRGRDGVVPPEEVIGALNQARHPA